MGFKEISPYEAENIFKLWNKDWALITAKHGDKVNMMTASWGLCGILWNKPVAVCFIRPQRYTFKFTEASDRLSLTFYDEKYRNELTLCGRKSGKDVDKIKETGFTLATDESGTPYFEEAKLVMICRKLYVDDLKKSAFIDPELLKNYPSDDFHRVYICEIEKLLQKEN